ncbi:homoserine O-acetyltransferase MetA [Lachnospiraceae bacterium HCP1S3_C3]|nr:homoserine O-succinyltransferase [Lachnospiraceae bacterium]MDD6857666.1 homoserine O-succinyltransferase [Lachnospiraceae bacterium]
MPIKVQGDLPAKAVIESENIFIMDENRAIMQDIRPLQVAILNLMPLKHETEIQLLRALSNTPLQVDVTFVFVKNHVSKNTPESHLNKFYTTFSEIKDKKFDGFIITGAPIELMEYEEVEYWDEIEEIMEWTKTNVTSTLHVCWGAQAGLYHHFGIQKHLLKEKMFGIYEHEVIHRKVPLMRGFDDVFLAPHSRHTEVRTEDIKNTPELTVLAESKKAGVLISMTENGKQIFLMGHPEYDRITLDTEYKRDKAKGMDIQIPYNYYKDDNPDNPPLLTWRAHANAFYTNWLNYYVYQSTPYEWC